MPESGGDTVLHHALLMDYDLGTLVIDPEDEEQYRMGPIKRGLGKESANSLNIKTEIVHLLAQKAGADPHLQNQHKISAMDIAKGCNQGR